MPFTAKRAGREFGPVRDAQKPSSTVPPAETCWFQNALRIEINGSAGSLAFDLEDMNHLYVHDGTEPAERAGFRRILVTEPGHPYLEGWWPPGHLLGYEHAFTHQAVDLLTAVADGTEPAPSFADGLRVQRVLAAVETSAANGSAWTDVPG